MTEFGYKKMLYEVIRMGISPGKVLTSLGMASAQGKRVFMRAMTKYPEYAIKCKTEQSLPHPISGKPIITDPTTKIFTAASEAERLDMLPVDVLDAKRDILIQMQPSIQRDHLADKVQCVLEMMLQELGRRGFGQCSNNDLLKAIPSMTTTMRLLREQSTANVATVSKQIHEIERRRKAAAQAEAQSALDAPPSSSAPDAPAIEDKSEDAIELQPIEQVKVGHEREG